MDPVTEALQAIERGEPQAADRLLPLVYDELRQLAAQRLAQEKPGQTLQATALVHEAYLRLIGADREQPWDHRRHFFAAAAEAMRRILIEKARRKRRLRHGGDRQRLPLDDQLDLAEEAPSDDVLALDAALEELARDAPDAAAVVKLRYFAGLTAEQAADALGRSLRTVNRQWAYARACLYRRLRGSGGDA